VFLALLSRFVGTYSCAVIRVKSGGRRAAEDRETEETEERQRDSVSNDAQNGALSGVELASQEFWAWLAHLPGVWEQSRYDPQVRAQHMPAVFSHLL
jgi:hypothetical protein